MILILARGITQYGISPQRRGIACGREMIGKIGGILRDGHFRPACKIPYAPSILHEPWCAADHIPLLHHANFMKSLG